jgi:hypothetical protein
VSRAAQNWMALGYQSDPVPGDPHVVSTYASRYAEVASEILDAHRRLTAISNRHDSESEFIDKFRSEAAKVSAKIEKAHHRYDGLAKAVAEYAAPLEDAQTRSLAAVQLYSNTADSVQHDDLLMTKYQNELNYNANLTDDEKKHYTLLIHHLQQSAGDAATNMQRARSELQAAIESRDQAAKRAANKIENVENTGGLNDSGWTQWWDANGTWMGHLVEAIGIAAAIIILFVPGLGEAEILIILAISAAITITNAIMQLTAGTESPGEATLDIIFALIPFGGAALAKSALLTAGKAVVESGVVEDAGKAISTAAKSPAVRKLEEEVAEEAEGGVKGVVKNVFDKLVKNDTETMEKLQTLANKGLAEGTEAGNRAAAVAEHEMWKIRVFLGPVPEFVGEKVVHKLLDEPIDKLFGRDE